jgi:hypothetical protein
MQRNPEGRVIQVEVGDRFVVNGREVQTDRYSTHCLNAWLDISSLGRLPREEDIVSIHPTPMQPGNVMEFMGAVLQQTDNMNRGLPFAMPVLQPSNMTELKVIDVFRAWEPQQEEIILPGNIPEQF